MAIRLRQAGQGQARDGSTVTWSVAEGRGGRRWREVVVTAAGIRSSLLLELDPEGRFSHLELSTPSGLLTLHPEPDRTLHGNTVTAAGVGHVEGRPWNPEAVVLVEGSAVCAAVAAAPTAAAGGGPAEALRIGLDLRLEAGLVVPDRAAAGQDGLPALATAETWPLERPG